MIKITDYAAKHSFSRLKNTNSSTRRDQAHEVEIEVLYCGVCYSDIHLVKNE